jgi:uncharacterized protein (DUF433 family)
MTMQDKTSIKNYIEFREGEAVIVDHPHLKAEYVARSHVNGGDSIEEVMEHYGLTYAEVYAALTYYYENRKVLDAEMERFWAEAKASGKTVADFRAEIERRKRDRND